MPITSESPIRAYQQTLVFTDEEVRKLQMKRSNIYMGKRNTF